MREISVYKAKSKMENNKEMFDVSNLLYGDNDLPLEKRLDFAEKSLDRLIKDGYFPAIKFLLETKGKSRGYGLLEKQDYKYEPDKIVAALNRKYPL